MLTLEFEVAQFQRDEIINTYERQILELVETIFPKPHYCFAELPLQRLCKKTGYLSPEIWRFWKDSRIDIVVMLPSGKAGLAVECQSTFHDTLDAQLRDARKAFILSSAKIPLVYVRHTKNKNIYRFWTFSGEEVMYNYKSRSGYTELFQLLKEQCVS